MSWAPSSVARPLSRAYSRTGASWAAAIAAASTAAVASPASLGTTGTAAEPRRRHRPSRTSPPKAQIPAMTIGSLGTQKNPGTGP